MKKVIFLLAILATSCTANKLHKSGTYTIATRNGNATTFKEVKGRYMLQSDTLKPGDKVVMIEIKDIR
jgi:hypothetical protein